MFPLLINIMFVDKAVSAITLCSRSSKALHEAGAWQDDIAARVSGM